VESWWGEADYLRNVTLWANRSENLATNDILVHLGKEVECVSGNDTTGIERQPQNEKQ